MLSSKPFVTIRFAAALKSEGNHRNHQVRRRRPSRLICLSPQLPRLRPQLATISQLMLQIDVPTTAPVCNACANDISSPVLKSAARLVGCQIAAGRLFSG